MFVYDNADDPNLENDIDGIKYIDFDKWHNTGTFTSFDLENDLDMTDLSYANGSTLRSNSSYMRWLHNGAVYDEFVLKYDKDNKTIKTVYKIDAPENFWKNTRPDGYTFAAKYGEMSLEYTIYDPNGKKLEDKIVFSGNKEDWWGEFASCRDSNATLDYKYIAYALCADNKRDTSLSEVFDMKIYGIKRDGSRDVVYSKEGVYTFGNLEVVSNFASWTDAVPPMASRGHIYSEEDGKVYALEIAFRAASCSDPDKRVFFSNLASKLYGKKAVGYFKNTDSDGNVTDEAYTLITVDNDTEILGNSYKYMGTNDGEIYLVQNADDKWGYIDSNGKELAFFDDAGSFIGDYAPVVSNGKGYLIDRSMNKISEDITATGAQAIDDGIYRFTASNDFYLVTYSNEEVSVAESEPSSSTGGYIEPSYSAPESAATTESPNPSTGVAAVSALPIAAVVGAIVIISKKKK